MDENNNKNTGGLKKTMILVIIAAAAVLIIWALTSYLSEGQGSDGYKKDDRESVQENNSVNELGGFVTEKIKISKFKDVDDDIKSAYEILEGDKRVRGYLVNVTEEGADRDILLAVSFDAQGEVIQDIAVKKHHETAEGAGIASEEFYKQFRSLRAPIYLEGEEEELKDDWDDSIEDLGNMGMVKPIEGARVSSEAVVDGVNEAYEFLQKYMIDR